MRASVRGEGLGRVGWRRSGSRGFGRGSGAIMRAGVWDEGLWARAWGEYVGWGLGRRFWRVCELSSGSRILGGILGRWTLV
jgi:hypothetical protein